MRTKKKTPLASKPVQNTVADNITLVTAQDEDKKKTPLASKPVQNTVAEDNRRLMFDALL